MKSESYNLSTAIWVKSLNFVRVLDKPEDELALIEQIAAGLNDVKQDHVWSLDELIKELQA